MMDESASNSNLRSSSSWLIWSAKKANSDWPGCRSAYVHSMAGHPVESAPSYNGIAGEKPCASASPLQAVQGIPGTSRTEVGRPRSRRIPAMPAHSSAGAFSRFHPAVADWFRAAFGSATAVQAQAWAHTAQGRSALITAPTGSGKTLAAFLAAINELVVEGEARGLADEVYVVYVSPLKALSNDIDKNLQAPLRGIEERLEAPFVLSRAQHESKDEPAIHGSTARSTRAHHERREAFRRELTEPF